MSTQTDWDLEDATAFRTSVRRLRQAVAAAEEAERSARSEFARAIKARKAAQAELAAYLDRETAPPGPLLEWAARNGNGHAEAAEAKPASGPTPAPAPPAPELLDLSPLPYCYAGIRHLADLSVHGHRAALWMRVCGTHVVTFDVEAFGNWETHDRRPEHYTPTLVEVATEASAKAGYWLLPSEAFQITNPSGRLWAIELECKPESHPEPWRLRMVQQVVPPRWVGPLLKNGLNTWGDLAYALETLGEWDKLTRLPTKPAKGDRAITDDLLDRLHAEWKQYEDSGCEKPKHLTTEADT